MTATPVPIAAACLFSLLFAACPKPQALESRLEIETIVLPPIETNCYILSLAGQHGAVVIDPGADAEGIVRRLDARKLALAGIVLTHNHSDHAGAARALQFSTRAPIYRHPDQNQIARTRVGTSLAGARVLPLGKGQILQLGPVALQVIHTPGHSPGGVSLYHNSGVLFSGDLLFAGSVGRSDLPGASAAELDRSLRVRLAPLADGVRVLPGHGPETTLGAERRSNPFLK